MKIIEPSATLIDIVDERAVYEKIERCGRVCYRSEPKGKPEEFVRMLIKRGHESVLEHVSLTFHVVCDRGVMAELTRHRLASFSVESTRYVKYDELKFITDDIWPQYLCDVEKVYTDAVNAGIKPEDARAVLPLCTATSLYMTANLREWRHILKLRTSKAAHPQARQVAGMILQTFRDKLPVIVEDIEEPTDGS